MSAQFTHRLEARLFDADADLMRTTTWAGMERPDFMDPGITSVEAAQSFLRAASISADTYLAVVDRNPDTGFRCVSRDHYGRPLKDHDTVIRGAVACLRQSFNGEVVCEYIDPAFRTIEMTGAVNRLVDRMNINAIGAPRLTVAA